MYLFCIRSVVHLSELVGPLPAAAEAKEEESSESTLTEANNGIDKPPTNPAQVHNWVLSFPSGLEPMKGYRGRNLYV